MTYFPNEPPYTVDYLSDEHKEFIRGWNLAIQEIKTYFANKKDGYGDTETVSDTFNKIANEFADATEEELVDWMKSARQQFIVSFVDGYSDEELKERGWKG